MKFLKKTAITAFLTTALVSGAMAASALPEPLQPNKYGFALNSIAKLVVVIDGSLLTAIKENALPSPRDRTHMNQMHFLKEVVDKTLTLVKKEKADADLSFIIGKLGSNNLEKEIGFNLSADLKNTEVHKAFQDTVDATAKDLFKYLGFKNADVTLVNGDKVEAGAISGTTPVIPSAARVKVEESDGNSPIEKSYGKGK